MAVVEITLHRGMNLPKARVTVVGMKGNIGQLVLLMLADKIVSLTLVANTSNTVAIQTYQGIDVDDPGPNGFVSNESDDELVLSLRRDIAVTMKDGKDGQVASVIQSRKKELPIRITTNLDSGLGDVDIVAAAQLRFSNYQIPSSKITGQLCVMWLAHTTYLTMQGVPW